MSECCFIILTNQKHGKGVQRKKNAAGEKNLSSLGMYQIKDYVQIKREFRIQNTIVQLIISSN